MEVSDEGAAALSSWHCSQPLPASNVRNNKRQDNQLLQESITVVVCTVHVHSVHVFTVEPPWASCEQSLENYWEICMLFSVVKIHLKRRKVVVFGTRNLSSIQS